MMVSLVGQRHIDPMDRFFMQIDKKGTSCWMWTGTKSHNGYGVIGVNGKNIRAHRFSWSVFNNKDIPDGMVVMHSCDNPSCVNPEHLSIGTHYDNEADKVAKGRQARGESLSKAQGNQKRCGEKNPRSKLTEDDVMAIMKDTDSQRIIAKKYNVTQATINLIKTRRTWRHVK